MDRLEKTGEALATNDVQRFMRRPRVGVLVALVAIAFGMSASAVSHWCSSTPASRADAGQRVCASEADSAFAMAMITHHQVAIDMARRELRDGRNEQLRRLAQEIIVTQLDEIAVMRRVLCQSP
jgi:uncharacterized protein (DUF305 family)